MASGVVHGLEFIDVHHRDLAEIGQDLDLFGCERTQLGPNRVETADTVTVRFLCHWP